LDDSISGLDAPITVISGIGKKYSQTLANLDLTIVNDLLYNFPNRYEDYSKLLPINRLKYGESLSIIGTVETVSHKKTKNKNLNITEIVLTDGTGFLRAIWFNKPYLVDKFDKGDQLLLSGKIDMYLGRLSMSNPEWEPLEKEHLHTNRILPVYPLTTSLTQRIMRRVQFQAINNWTSHVKDHIPPNILKKTNLVGLQFALKNIHFPDNQNQLVQAQKRLAFDEILLLQLSSLSQKRTWQSADAKRIQVAKDVLESRFNSLPYQLTTAQKKVLNEILSDLQSGIPMNRLLQGDVGSGKTVIAALAATSVVDNCGQVAVMAPTSILAEQHFITFNSLINDTFMINTNGRKLNIKLLTGDTSDKDKTEIKQGLIDSSIQILIGTHALIEDSVTFSDLQLSVIDEQHRFGVAQRAALREKNINQHILVMTATPIPRSLALTLYGDLDLSVIDEMPPGRIKIDTHLLHPIERERAYALIDSQIKQGLQAFIIYPYVEQGDNDDIMAAVEERERIQKQVFTQYKVGLLHGRMKPSEKDAEMKDFRDGHYQVLVSTSVVEVGVDIPNATIILIEGANRFGLAQLHQMRGRVGRGNNKSYCLLIPDKEDAVENERLLAMTVSDDGFELAERDLEQRGPGEFLGIRQSGYSTLKLATLSDINLIEQARRIAQEIFDEDPEFSKLEYQPMYKMAEKVVGFEKGDIS